MLRLLSDDDIRLSPTNPIAIKALRAERRKLFRALSGCLTRDYARLLAGISDGMVQSGVDRPDLARALAKNRCYFALAICSVEFRLAFMPPESAKSIFPVLVGAFDAFRGSGRQLLGRSFPGLIALANALQRCSCSSARLAASQFPTTDIQLNTQYFPDFRAVHLSPANGIQRPRFPPVSAEDPD